MENTFRQRVSLFFEEYQIPQSVRCIDLSMDFRHKDASIFQESEFVYGLPELNGIDSPKTFVEDTIYNTALMVRYDDKVVTYTGAGNYGGIKTVFDNGLISTPFPFAFNNESFALSSVSTQ